MVISVKPERDWVRLGALDPYFGVISDANLKKDAITDEQRQRFFEGGVVDAGNVMSAAASLFGVSEGEKALDFGCGVGRITLGLAPYFGEILGIDISPGMLAEARLAAEARGVRNATFRLSSEGIPPETFDLVHTYIVLQHIPQAEGERVISKLVEATKVGGVGALHFLIDRPHSLKYRMRQLVKNNVQLRQIGNVAAGRGWNYPAMQMNAYSFPRVVEILSARGVENFTCFRVDDWGHVGLFLFYRRSARGRVHSAWSNPAK